MNSVRKMEIRDDLLRIIKLSQQLVYEQHFQNSLRLSEDAGDSAAHFLLFFFSSNLFLNTSK